MTAVEFEQTTELQPTPLSASAARRLVRSAIEECGLAEWIDAAELAVSEIVTNGVVHAHTLMTLVVRCTSEELRVEVHDDSAFLPVQRRYGSQATTGRGMALVAAVTSSHGVDDLPGGGKAVWFTISSAAPEPSIEHLLAQWTDEEPVADPPSAGRTAQLLGLPPMLWLAGDQHNDGLLRELQLYRQGRDLPIDDLETVNRARSMIRVAVDRAVSNALAKGDARNPLPEHHPAPPAHLPAGVDLDVDVIDDNPAGDFALLQDVLDEAERLAADGQLLARPGLPEVVAVRDWAAESIIAQLAGQPPAPWPGASAERFAQKLDEEARQIDWDSSVVSQATRGAVAADDANRILAISQTLADTLGWSPNDLIGRRIVAIVPPQYREAHVAGFTRHLTTGQAHALNVRLELPVLCSDGSEIDCEFFIEAHRSNSGRAIYIAWIEPL